MTLYKDKFKIDSTRLKDWDYSSEAVYFITIVTRDRKCIFGSIEDEKMILNANGKIVENELLKSIKIRKNWFFHNWIVMPNHIHLLIEIQNISEANIIGTHIVETQTMPTNVAETYCCAPLQEQSVSKIGVHIQNPILHIVEAHRSASTPGISTTIKETNLNAQIMETETISTNVAETHCGAPLQEKLRLKFSRKSNSISSFVAIFKSVTTKQINDSESIWQSNYHDHIVRDYKRFEIIYNYIKNNPRSWDTDSINSNFQ